MMGAMRVGRALLLSGMTGVLLLGWLAGPAFAQDRDGNQQVVLTGRAEVREGETFDNVVIFDGPATIDGDVTGSVVAFNGDVSVSGTVGENVVVINGDLTIADGATVQGDVMSRRRPSIAPGTVQGEVRRLQPGAFTSKFAIVSKVAVWLAVSISTLVLGLILLALFPRAADAIVAVATDATWASIGMGLALFFGLPIAAVLILVTIVGIPLGLAFLLALFLLYMLGYTWSAWILGRRLLRSPRGRFVSFLAGWAILRVLALIPVVGGIVWFLAVVYGLGAMFVAGWRARRTPVVAPPPPAPVPA